MTREFNPNIEIENIVNFIQKYFSENGTPATKAVIGISGGKDSTIAATLLVRALGADRVIGVLMPNGHQADIADSREVVKLLGIKHYEINIGPAMEALTAEMPDAIFGEDNDVYYTNTPARLRMATLYGVAGLVGGRVCNTGNASEFFIGYTTKYGDLAGDFALLRNYTVSDIYRIGDMLAELPSHLVHKLPADGMSGKTDEDKTGVPYGVIDDFLLTGKHPASMAIYEKMMAMHRRNEHKKAVRLPAPTRCSGYLRCDEGCFCEF